MVNQRVFLALVIAAIDGFPANIPTDFQLDEYLLFAKEQQLEALFIMGLRKSNIPISKEIRNKQLAAAMVSARQIRLKEQLCLSFQQNAIDYMPLKGCMLKSLYPSDELRSMGDIDILIRGEQYELIRLLMLSEGFLEGRESDYEYVWEKNQIHVELHKRLIPSYNKDYYAYFGEGWQLAKKGSTPYEYEMTPEDTFIYLFTHYAKHYRDSGVGIRQALDLYVFRRAYPEMNEGYIKEKMTLLQLEKFYVNTMHMLDVWFNNAIHTDASKLISDRLFQSGVFGTRESYLSSSMLKQINRHGDIGKAKCLNWFKRVFLPYSGMRQLYPVLRKHPVLLPVMWVVRWGDIFLHKRGMLQKYIVEDRTLDDESVRKYHEMLRKSGLDFNFK